MITRYAFDNNVRSTLSANITAVATSLTVFKVAAPFRDPPVPDAASGTLGIMTLTDSLSNPAKVEIVTYSTWVDNGLTITLGGLTRGAESTTASAFVTGNYTFQGPTHAMFDTPLIDLNHDLDTVRLPFGLISSDPLVIGAADPSSVIIMEVRDESVGPADPNDLIVRMRVFSGGLMLGLSNPALGLTNQNSNVLYCHFTDYGPASSYTKPILYMPNIRTEVVEQLHAIRYEATTVTLASLVTIDWAQTDIFRATLTSNATLTFSNISINDVAPLADRRLTLVIDIGGANPGFVITWPASVKWPSGVAPVFSSGTNKRYVIDFFYDGTSDTYCGHVRGIY